jgi:DNA replicative helicase MCM subunit Mcm2 (Cdc46/Mcm family)
LEGLIRLSEARAKAELRGFVSESDAKEVIELIKESQRMTIKEEFKKRMNRQGKSSYLKEFINNLIKASVEINDTIFEEVHLKRIYESMQIPPNILQFSELVENLNSHGVLLIKVPGKFKLIRT